MIVDSSALIAIVNSEPDGSQLADALTGQPVLISAATLLETTIVVDASMGATDRGRFEQLIAASDITIEPFTAEHARLARQAYRDFGRGSGHPARLNMGDCFSYALAKSTGEPLLYKGDDFTHTDLRSALVD